MKPTNEVMITNLLHNLGIPSHLKGYKYIVEALNIIITKDLPIKEVYNLIALKYNTNIILVERLIRYAIEISFNQADYKLIIGLFGHTLNINKDKPSNKLFLFTLSNALKIKKVE